MSLKRLCIMKDIFYKCINPLAPFDTSIKSEIVWEDLPLLINAIDDNNPNPPTWKIIANSGNTSTTAYLEFENGSNEDTYASVAKYSDDHNSLEYAQNPQWTLSFWFNPKSRGSGILEIPGQLSIDIDYNDKLRIKWGNESYETLLNRITYNSWYHILVRNDSSSSTNTKVQVFVNNRRRMNERYTTSLSAAWGSGAWSFGARGDAGSNWWYSDVAIEELVLYNIYVSNDQRNELWNSGEGRDSIVTGADITNVRMWLHFNETSGTTIPNSATNETNKVDGSISGTHYEWKTGGIGSGAPVGGIKCMTFDKGQEVSFAQQIFHKYKLGEPISMHLHISTKTEITNSSEMPKFGLEYLIWNINGEKTDTKILSSSVISGQTFPIPLTQQSILLFDNVVTDNIGDDINISAMILGRLYRDDNCPYNDEVYLLQGDWHIPMDSVGSRTQWVK